MNARQFVRECQFEPCARRAKVAGSSPMMNKASARFAVSESALFRDLELSMSSHASTARAYARAQNERFIQELSSSCAFPVCLAARTKLLTSAQAADGWRRTCANRASTRSRSCPPPAIPSSTASGSARARTSRPSWSTAITTSYPPPKSDGWDTEPFEPVVQRRQNLGARRN